jgi:sterol desaturase/sphingolipid hydroxylase (fatty acid hydroxylase superfamily)
VNDKGLMDKNFGIAFYLFDRLFGTLADDWPAFNRRGYASALERFGTLVESAPSSAGSRHGSRPEGRDLSEELVRPAGSPPSVGWRFT